MVEQSQKKSTKYQCPVKSDFKVDEEQIRDLEDALGDESSDLAEFIEKVDG